MINLSTGFVNALAGFMGLKEILDDMVIEIRSGVQPANTTTQNGADLADAGVLLWRATLNAAINDVAEVRAVATIDVTGATDNPTVFVIGGISYDLSSLPAFTTDGNLTISLTSLINSAPYSLGYTAVVDASTNIIVTAPKNLGVYANYEADTNPNGTCMIKADDINAGATVTSNFSGGVSAERRLSCPNPVAGVITYNPAVETWSGLGLTAGVAQHFRIKCSGPDDTGQASTSLMRIDGSVAQIGGDMRVSVADVVVGKLQMIEAFSVAVPQ